MKVIERLRERLEGVEIHIDPIYGRKAGERDSEAWVECEDASLCLASLDATKEAHALGMTLARALRLLPLLLDVAEAAHTLYRLPLVDEHGSTVPWVRAENKLKAALARLEGGGEEQ